MYIQPKLGAIYLFWLITGFLKPAKTNAKIHVLAEYVFLYLAKTDIKIQIWIKFGNCLLAWMVLHLRIIAINDLYLMKLFIGHIIFASTKKYKIC